MQQKNSPEPIPVVPARGVMHRLIWSACFLWVGVCVLMFLLTYMGTKDNSQAASAAAGACAFMLAGYVGAKSLDEMIG